MVKNYLGGQWVDSPSASDHKRNVAILNPATEEVLDHCPLGSKAEAENAIGIAQEAFHAWRRTPVIDRVQPLFRLKILMEEHAEELARQITLENGKTLLESRGSVRRAIQMVETACGMPNLMMGEITEDIAPGIDSQAIRRPMGVFVAICPFNFPAMVPFWFWPFGVASGNTFIVKPSERVPLTQQKIFELIDQAGFPPGVINLVNGDKEVVQTLCQDPRVQGISFVGSTPVALDVYKQGCDRGKRVQALGGAKNCMVVLPDAVIEKTSQVCLESITGCAGERCLAGSVVISVGAGTLEKVRDRIVPLAQDIRVGNGLKSTSQMGPLISRAAVERINGLIDRAIEEGAEVLLDGRAGRGNGEPSQGFFMRPTVLSGIRADMEIAQEEVFGPVVLLAQVDTFDEAIEWVNSSRYANTTSLFTSNGAMARKFCYEVDPSMIGVNIGVPAPMAFFSFGGSKQSFFGDTKAHGRASVNFFTDTKVAIHRWMSDSSIW